MFFRNKNKNPKIEDRIRGSVLGACIGDIVGMPFEFMSKEEINKCKIFKPKNLGIHEQVYGTWSDDSSMTFCTIESLCKGYDYKDMGDTFVKWAYEGYWTPHNVTFDIGGATANALRLIRTMKYYKGVDEEHHCGNGSLMRIMPILFYIHKNKSERFKIIEEVSSLTHSNMICIIGCAIYIEFALNLLEGQEIHSAYENMQNTIWDIYGEEHESINKFKRLLIKNRKITDFNKDNIRGTGYIVDTLETALYSFLSTSNYKEAISTSISFGHDTDTTACITGALAGMYYGVNNIPKKLIENIIKLDEINNLTDKFIIAYKDNFNKK